MPNLHDVERRIKSVKSTRQITNTMRMIASAKVPKSSARLQSSHPYTSAICKMLAGLTDGGVETDFELLQNREVTSTALLVVVVSDKGLAGGFNSNILRKAQAEIDNNKREGKNTLLILCGKKAYAYFSFRQYDEEMKFLGTSDNPQFDQAEEIGNYCIEHFLDESIDEVSLLYNKCKNSIEQTPTKSVILPVSAEKLATYAAGIEDEADEEAKGDALSSSDGLAGGGSAGSSDKKDKEFLDDVEYDPSENGVLSGLVPVYIRTTIFNALLESAAGEQVARRVAMQNATDSADDMIDSLVRLYNSVRQGAITTEINEIVGGAEALKD